MNVCNHLNLSYSILKSIEFPRLSGTTSSSTEEDVKEKLSVVTQAQSKPLEVLLLERNKALQSENTALKVANSELQGNVQKDVKYCIVICFFWLQVLPKLSTLNTFYISIVEMFRLTRLLECDWKEGDLFGKKRLAH